MDSQADRLRKARLARGYREATEAALAMGARPPTYLAHENPESGKGLSRAGQRYAAFFRVSYDWLMTGRGEMKDNSASIPIVGFVGAGSTVEPVGDTAGYDAPYERSMPDAETIAGLIVKGTSQWPRYIDGEVILYETKPLNPQDLVNTYAVIDLEDGRRLIKLLRRSASKMKWTMESHNATPEETDAILAAYRVVGRWRPEALAAGLALIAPSRPEPVEGYADCRATRRS